MSKSKKNSVLWYKCEKCNATVVQKDTEIHKSNCPPVLTSFVHPLIWNESLTGALEIKSNEEIKGLSYHDKNNLVFLSPSAIQLCSLVIGEWALVQPMNAEVVPCAKIVWPTAEKTLSSVLITQSAYDLYWKDTKEAKVTISKLQLSQGLKEAKSITLIVLNGPKTLQITPELNTRLKKLHLNRFVTENNKLSLMFYGKQVDFLIVSIEASETEVTSENASVVKDLQSEFADLSISKTNDDCSLRFRKIVNTTVFKLFNDKKQLIKEVKNINPFNLIGGVDAEILELQDLIDVALRKVSKIQGLKSIQGVLLYGTSGTGKTMIANAVAEMSKCHVVAINGADLYSKYTGDVEATISNLFQEALDNEPSIILLDDMDILCPVRGSRTTEQEKRVVASILTQIDKLRGVDNGKVFILATSNKPDGIDPAFRRCGRLDREIEVPIPNPRGRLQILKKLLSETKHSISDSDLEEVAYKAHGFVGSDLSSLCSRAMFHALKTSANANIEMDDLRFALTRVRPSAMREVQIEVPNVKWTDIGGQHDLKLILRQAVEWPLKHADSFVRIGITPPRGVLMFGPPGCSKTMIAKALATESGLNFLSIKGPELFSKWVGESERAVREVFRKARQVAPSIVFFDEIDALGGERGSSGNASVQERVLAQLLTELDGVTPLGDVTILAATNRPDRIDKALLRPGRLDRIVYVPLPNTETRQEIFNIKFAKMPVVNVDVEALVELTEGYSGAEIQAVCHEAAMKALEEDIKASSVTCDHFHKALQVITPRISPSLLEIYENYKNNL